MKFRIKILRDRRASRCLFAKLKMKPIEYVTCETTCQCYYGRMCDNIVYTTLMPLLYKDLLNRGIRTSTTQSAKDFAAKVSADYAKRTAQMSKGKSVLPWKPVDDKRLSARAFLNSRKINQAIFDMTPAANKLSFQSKKIYKDTLKVPKLNEHLASSKKGGGGKGKHSKPASSSWNKESKSKSKKAKS